MLAEQQGRDHSQFSLVDTRRLAPCRKWSCSRSRVRGENAFSLASECSLSRVPHLDGEIASRCCADKVRVVKIMQHAGREFRSTLTFLDGLCGARIGEGKTRHATGSVCRSDPRVVISGRNAWLDGSRGGRPGWVTNVEGDRPSTLGVVYNIVS